VEARAAPAVSLAAEAAAPYLRARIGARFRITADPVAAPDRPLVRTV
jgi:hypothetical protein